MSLLQWNFKSCMVIFILYFHISPQILIPCSARLFIMVVSFPKTMVASGSNIMAVSCSIVMGEYDGTVSNTMAAFVMFPILC